MILITFGNHTAEIVPQEYRTNVYSGGSSTTQPHSGLSQVGQTQVSPYVPSALNPGNSIASAGVGMIKTTARPISSNTINEGFNKFFRFHSVTSFFILMPDYKKKN
jgi:hypothetical protein